MRVILNADIENLGEEGDVCEVKPGYARNYLLPRNLVLLDNRRNRAYLESRRQEIEQRKEKKRIAAQSSRERIESETMVFEMPAGENGRLFGSLSSAGISERLEQMGIDIARRQIDVPEKTIKNVGTHKVTVRLYGGEEAILTVNVVPAGGSRDAEAAPKESAGSRDAEAAPKESAERRDSEAGATESAAGEENTAAEPETGRQSEVEPTASTSTDEAAADTGENEGAERSDS